MEYPHTCDAYSIRVANKALVGYSWSRCKTLNLEEVDIRVNSAVIFVTLVDSLYLAELSKVNDFFYVLFCALVGSNVLCSLFYGLVFKLQNNVSDDLMLTAYVTR